MAKRVLITGATGFIGSYIARYLLEKGVSLRAICRKTSDKTLLGEAAGGIEWVEADLIDIGALEDVMKDVDHVYHAAAMVSFKRKDRDRMYKVNIEGTANLVNIALDFGIEKFLFVSSIATLSKSRKDVLIDENAEWEKSKLNSHYGLTKYLSEMEVWRGIQEGLNGVIINPSLVLGAGFWDGPSNKLFKKIDEGVPFFPAGGNGYVDVRDVAKSAIGLMESDISGERFIINGANLTYQQAFETIAGAMNKKAPNKKVKNWQAMLGWRLDQLKIALFGGTPILTRELVRLIQEKYAYDNTKLREALGYSFIPIEQTLRETSDLFIQSKKAGNNYAILPL